MPNQNSKLRIPDPFIMKKEEVNNLVEAYLKGKAFTFRTVNIMNDPDIKAIKQGHQIFVETRGNQASNHDKDTVFDSSQLRIHLAEQIQVVMRLHERISQPTMYVVANPAIPRIEILMNEINNALDKLEIIRCWVNPNGIIKIDFPQSQKQKMFELELI